LILANAWVTFLENRGLGNVESRAWLIMKGKLSVNLNAMTLLKENKNTV
jgi:hypothetical protein